MRACSLISDWFYLTWLKFHRVLLAFDDGTVISEDDYAHVVCFLVSPG